MASTRTSNQPDADQETPASATVPTVDLAEASTSDTERALKAFYAGESIPEGLAVKGTAAGPIVVKTGAGK